MARDAAAGPAGCGRCTAGPGRHSCARAALTQGAAAAASDNDTGGAYAHLAGPVLSLTMGRRRSSHRVPVAGHASATGGSNTVQGSGGAASLSGGHHACGRMSRGCGCQSHHCRRRQRRCWHCRAAAATRRPWSPPACRLCCHRHRPAWTSSGGIHRASAPPAAASGIESSGDASACLAHSLAAAQPAADRGRGEWRCSPAHRVPPLPVPAPISGQRAAAARRAAAATSSAAATAWRQRLPLAPAACARALALVLWLWPPRHVTPCRRCCLVSSPRCAVRQLAAMVVTAACLRRHPVPPTPHHHRLPVHPRPPTRHRHEAATPMTPTTACVVFPPSPLPSRHGRTAVAAARGLPVAVAITTMRRTVAAMLSPSWCQRDDSRP